MLADYKTGKEIVFTNASNDGQVNQCASIQNRTGCFVYPAPEMYLPNQEGCRPLGKTYCMAKYSGLATMVRKAGGEVVKTKQGADTIVIDINPIDHLAMAAAYFEDDDKVYVIGVSEPNKSFYKNIQKSLEAYVKHSVKLTAKKERFRIFDTDEMYWLDLLKEGYQVINVMNVGLRAVDHNDRKLINIKDLDSIIGMISSTDDEANTLGLSYLASYNYVQTPCLYMFLLDIISNNKYFHMEKADMKNDDFLFMQSWFAMYKSRKTKQFYTTFVEDLATPYEKEILKHVLTTYPDLCKDLIDMKVLK